MKVERIFSLPAKGDITIRSRTTEWDADHPVEYTPLAVFYAAAPDRRDWADKFYRFAKAEIEG